MWRIAADKLMLASGSVRHCFILLRRLLNFQPLHHLPPHKIGQTQDPIIRADAIRSAGLIPSMTIHELPFPIDLDTAKDIFRLRNASEIWNVPLIGDMDPATATGAAVAALVTRAR